MVYRAPKSPWGGKTRWKNVRGRTRGTKIRGVVNEVGQSTLSLAFNLGGMLAGTLLVLYLDVFSTAPWALILFPGVLSVRGAIGGLFCGRLSTALHLGTVSARFTNNTRRFNLLVQAIIALTAGSSLLMGVTTALFSALTYGATGVDALAILSVAITTMGLSLIAISPITAVVSILSFKRGLNPDVVVYPVISTVADVIVTLCYISVLTGFTTSPLGWVVSGMVNVVFLSIAVYLLLKNHREPEFMKTVKEFLLTLVVVAGIVNLTGVILGKISHIIQNNTKVYVVYPALIDTVGDVGAIVGSTATTKLALGTVARSFSSLKQHLVEVSGAWTASLILFSLYAVVASSPEGLLDPPAFWRFFAQLIITNVLAVTLIVVISFAVAIYSLKRGGDPDNFVIPIESSLADSITTTALFIALIALA
jgi:mgtE-like transporter